MSPYHSSLKNIPQIDIVGKLERYEKNANVVFRLDICTMVDFPVETRECDLIYSEPAWKSGYQEFLHRAGRESSNYEMYIDAINNIIKMAIENKVDTWLIIGSHVLKKIMKPDRIYNVSLHGYKTNLCGWNDDNEYKEFSNNYEFIKLLSENHDKVWDFCAGYGNTGRIFAENSKKFVLSDINDKCVYYMANTIT